MSESLYEMLVRHEGLRLKPYTCSAGKLTIGVGRNLSDNGISRSEAYSMLRTDIVACKVEANRNFSWFRDLSLARRNVIVSMVFNLGMTRFLSFNRMLAAMKDDNFQLAADEMLDSLWAEQVGYRALELANTMRVGE